MNTTNTPDDIDLSEMLQMMNAFGAFVGNGKPLGTILDSCPDLKRKFRSLDPVVTAATFAGLLTVPALQANAVRLEALVRLSLTLCQGKQKPTDKFIADAFRILGEGMCGRMEDPSEDVMVGAIRSPWGNFRVLEGMWEGGTFYLQRFIDVLAGMPEDGSYDRLRNAIISLLRLSDAVCDRTKLDRWQLGAEMHADILPKRATAAWSLRRRHLRFSADDCRLLGMDLDDLSPFIFDSTDAESLADETLPATRLEHTPLVATAGAIYLVLPTAVSSAIRYFLVSALESAGMLDALRHALAVSYSELLAGTQFLGAKMGPRLPFKMTPMGSFAETVLSIDRGRYIHFLFFTDPLDDLNATGLADMNPASPVLGEEFDKRITAVQAEFSKQEGFRGGMTLIVGCGIGRGAMIGFGEADWPDWRVEYCSAYDFVTLSTTRGFKPATLWRMRDAKDRMEQLGATLQNINGLINLIAWMRSHDGHLVPHGDLPDDFVTPGQSSRLIIQQNSQRQLRHDAILSSDPRVEQFVDGTWIRLRKDDPSIFADDQAAALYGAEDFNDQGGIYSAFLADRRVWWGNVVTPSDTSGHAAYERWRTVSTWLPRAVPLLDSLSGLPDGPILWNAVFASVTSERQPIQAQSSYDKVRAAITVDVDMATRTITTSATDEYERAVFHPENIAERALVGAFVEGVARLAGCDDRTEIEAALLPRIVRDIHARHGHAIMMRTFRDMVRPDLEGRVVTISREDDAYVRFDLGWSVHDRALGPNIKGKSDCQGFLNKLVGQLENDIVEELRRYDRVSLLTMLIRNHELAITERDHWRRTSAAMIALHGDTPETMQTLRRHDFKLNAVFQSSRVLIEIAICECPTEGGIKPGNLDLSLLMAKASMLFEVGGWSDAIRWDMMQPELRITPLGDVHAKFGFFDEIVQPHANVTSGGRIKEAVESYSENLEERPVEATVEHKIDPMFAAAWEEQFGANIDQTRILIDYLENMGVERGKAILQLKRSKIHSIEAAGQTLDGAIADRLLDHLILTTRSSWRDIPAGFDDKDRQPWRYRRRLSILRRPLLQVDDAADPTILFAPGMVRDAFAYMVGNLHRGDFPDHQLSPKMRAWRARETGARGTAFATKVANALTAQGWSTRVEVNVTHLLGRGFPRDYGDVDVLAWRDDGRVLIIECKDVQFRKTYGEIAEQLADFRGEVRSNGRRDELRKHLDRMEIIRTHLDAVARFVDLPRISDVESHLMFRHPVPMQFALKRLSELVTVSIFDDIDKL